MQSLVPATDVVVADLFRDGQPLGVSPRLALQRAIDGWTAIGYMVDVGIELEAFVLSETARTGATSSSVGCTTNPDSGRGGSRWSAIDGHLVR